MPIPETFTEEAMLGATELIRDSGDNGFCKSGQGKRLLPLQLVVGYDQLRKGGVLRSVLSGFLQAALTRFRERSEQGGRRKQLPE